MGIFSRSKKQDKHPITASYGTPVAGGSPASSEAMIRRRQEWQKKTMLFKDAIPEVGHAGKFVRNVTSKVSLNITVNGEESELLSDILKDVPMGVLCESLFFVGEAMVKFKATDVNGKKYVEWEALGDKVYKMQRGEVLIKNEDGKWKPLEEGWEVFRIWNPDSDSRHCAYSTHKGMLDVMEGMYIHQLADIVMGKSRIANAGILYIPSDEFSESPDTDGGEPEPGSQAHFEQMLRRAMSDSIKASGSDDSIVPLVFFGSSEFADGIRHVMMERNDDAEAFAERMQSYINRYANGVDLPAEVILGMGKSNHWSSWKVDANTWQYYIEPLCELVAESILRNVIQAPSTNAIVKIECDGSRAIMKPDKTDAAIRSYAAGALSGEGVMEYAGFDEKYLSPNADMPKNALGNQPDGNTRLPSANFRGNEGEPVGSRNYQN